jgi:MoaA/NifB/PqqE/SkfB family radical SAM enzyme
MGVEARPVPSAQDVAEASSVVAQGEGHQLELQLGHLCNNRCVFCSSGQLTEMKLARPVPLAPILDALRQGRAAGASRVVFLGGEPTLHQGFVPALAEAKRLGFHEIVIFTNGVLLPQPGFIDRVVALGDFTWRISIQGGDEASHVAVTGRKQSFARIVAGLGRLRALGQRVTTNLCVNEHSYRSLPRFPELVARYGLSQLHVDIIRPSSTGYRSQAYLREIMPRYSAMAPYYREMLAGFERGDPSFDVNVGNLPYCVLPDWAHRIHHAGSHTVVQSAGADGFEDAGDKYAIHRSLRTHLPQCAACVFRPRCTGVFTDYLALYGGDEFQPVSRERLRALDPHQRSFDLLVEPALAPLLAGAADADRLAAPPAPWQAREIFRDGRARRVDLHYRAGAGADAPGATLTLLPPASSGAAADPAVVFETDRYRLALASHGWLPTEDLLALARWASERLAAAPDATVTRPLDAAAAARQRSDTELLARARARLAKLVRRVQRQRRFSTWSYGGATPRPDGRGTVIEVHGPEGYRVDLHLAIDTRDGRTQVDAAFVLGDRTGEAAARPVIEALVACLRGPGSL